MRLTLEDITRVAPPEPERPAPAPIPLRADQQFARALNSPANVRAYLESHGGIVTSEHEHDGATWLYLERCLVIPGCDATGSTDIGVRVGHDGKITYHNKHDRGVTLQWPDVREALEPGFKVWRDRMREKPPAPPAIRSVIASEPTPPRVFPFLNAAEFDALDLRRHYHVPGILAAGPVPTVFAGSFKTLKTSIAMDLLISLASGGKFLNHFTVNQCRVGVMSGESGGYALQDMARRVARAKGWTFAGIGDWFRVCTAVPNLRSVEDIEAIEQFINDNDIKVLVIDPAYLAMKGMRADDAGNLFSVGDMLEPLTRLGERTGCTLVIVHHNSRGATRANENEPAQLGDIAWSGFSEWAGQWVLLARRERYNPDGNGEHRLWLTAGGRDGHSTLVGVNVTEGRQEDPEGRRWEVEVEEASTARQGAAEAKEQSKEAKAQRYVAKDRETILHILSTIPGDTKTGIRERTTLNPARFNIAFASLVDDGSIAAGEFTKANGRTYPGFTRTHPDSPGLTHPDSTRVRMSSTHPDSPL